MQELNLTPKQTVILIVISLLFLAYQLFKLSKETITIELPEQQKTKPAYNPTTVHIYGFLTNIITS